MQNHQQSSGQSNVMKRFSSLLYRMIPLLPALAVGILIIVFRKRLSAILVPLLAALILAYMLDPAVDFVQERLKFIRKKSRGKAVVIVFTVFLLCAAAIAAFLLPAIAANIADIMENAPEIKTRLISYVQTLISEEHAGMREKVIDLIGSFTDFVDQKIASLGTDSGAISSYGKISDLLVGIVSSFVLTYYFLRDKTAILNGIFGLFPYKWRPSLSAAADELGMISAKFIQGQILVALIIGVIEILGLLLIGVPYAVLLGVIGGISNMIPYFGPFFGALPPVFTALMISPAKAVWVLILFVAVQQLDNNFLSPKIIEGNLGIHPITIIIIVFIGQEFFGFWGIIASVPVYAMVKCILVRIFKAYRCQVPL